MDWQDLDPSDLFAVVRDESGHADAERMIWAFDQTLAAARVDPSLLDHLAAAAICTLAYRDETTPRHVADQLFRRAIADEAWRDRYAGLLGATGDA